ncbi:MAG: Flp pilus assembly protein CpaB [Alphaproteobacteria bacterium]|nr:MAG: Flp pilus assembly protein CpaB [Alphaproteobacteria bacterium]
MRLLAILALVLGLGLAGTAVYYVSREFRSMEDRLRSQRNEPGIELTTVAVAVKPLRFGQVLRRDDVALSQWPLAAKPPNAFTSLEDLFGPEGTKPRSILRMMEPGEPVLVSKVTDFGQPAGITQRLRPGMRAFTINVNVQTGVSGLLKVGDYVDIYITGQDRGKQVTKLLLEKLELIAIDQNVDDSRTAAVVARTVTVEVTPKQAALLELATNSGRLTLALRGVNDDTVLGDLQIDRTAIFGAEEVVEEVAPEVKQVVRVRRGTTATEATEVEEVPTE